MTSTAHPSLSGTRPLATTARTSAAFAAALLLSLANPTQAQEILIAGFDSGVHRYDFQSGDFLGVIGNVNDPLGITTGPDGNIYIAEEATNKVLRFDGTNFAFMDEFVADDPLTPADENGPLAGPAGVLFGPDGNLYVASFNNDRILRYDGTSGAFIDTFVSANSGGLNGPDAGIAFGPDGHLYVPSYFNRQVIRYDGKTGASMGAFVTFGLGGLTNPRSVVFRPDGRMLVAGEGSNQIHEYDRDGNSLGSFANYNNVAGLAISPIDGNVYATNVNASNARRFNGTDGSGEGVAVTSGAGGLDLAVFLSFHPDPYLHLSRFKPGSVGSDSEIKITGATPGAFQIWMFGGAVQSQQLTGCPHLFFGVQSPILRLKLANAAGESSFNAFVGPDLLGVGIVAQALEPETCRVTQLVVQTFE